MIDDDFTDEKNVQELVSNIAAITGLSTQAEIYSDALALLGWAVGEIARGRVIASVGGEGEGYHQLDIPAFRSIQKNL